MVTTAYKLYLKDVLGIKAWLKPASADLAEDTNQLIREFDGPLRPEREQQKWSLITLHLQKESGSYFESEAQELFLKMKSAMKLNPRLTTLDLEIDSDHQDHAIPWIMKHLKPQALLVLTENPRNNQRSPIFETWAPSSLLQNSERKKAAWEVMQLAMRELKN